MNKADALDAEVLAEFATKVRANASSDLEQVRRAADGTSRYYNAIRIKPLCLVCHGDGIASGVQDALSRHYPKDLATGYALGDLRGALVVEWRASSKLKLDAPNSKQISMDLLTGGAPSVADISRLKEKNFQVVIDLRPLAESGPEEAQLVQKAGMQFIRFPIRGAQDLTFERAEQLDALLRRHAGKAKFVHCRSSERVGAIFALMAFRQGNSLEASLQRGRAAGLDRLQAQVRAKLASGREGR